MLNELIKLQIKQRRQNTDLKKKSVSLIVPFCFLLLFVAVVAISVYMSARAFYKLRFGNEFITAVFSVLQIILTVFSLTAILKNLYFSNDSLLLLKLPIKKTEIYLSKIIFIFLGQLTLSVCYVYLTAGIYGIVSGQPVGYFFLLLLAAIISSFFSLGLAGVLSVPAVYIVNFLKPRLTLKLIFIAILTIAFFLVYMYFMNAVVRIVDLTKEGGYLPPEIVSKVRSATSWMYLSTLLTRTVTGVHSARYLAMYLALTVVLCAGAFFLARKTYFRAQAESIEYAVTSKRGKNKPVRPFVSFFYKEILTVIRDGSSSVQVFGMALSMPIMVYFTTKMAAAAGSSQIGGQIVFGVCVLSLFTFLAMGDSVSATAYSRDGAAGYISDILPYSENKQLGVKILFGVTLSAVPFLASLIALAAAKYVDVGEFFALAFAGDCFLLAHVADSVIRDKKNPSYSEYTDTINDRRNSTLSLITGLSFAAVCGILALILSYTVSPLAAKLVVCGAAVLYLAAVAAIRAPRRKEAKA